MIPVHLKTLSLISLILLFIFSLETPTRIIVWQSLTLVVLSLAMSWFWISLLPNKTPLISRYALLIDGKESLAEQRHTRLTTLVWALFLTGLWSWKLNLISQIIESSNPLMPVNFSVEVGFYLGSFALFVGEFYIRKLYLPNHQDQQLIPFLKDISRISLPDIWNFERNRQATESQGK